jgi:hypothetical protein
MSVVGRARRATGIAFVAGLGLAAGAGAFAIVAGADRWSAARVAAGVALAALAWARPVAAVAVLLAIAPVFGNRPTTAQYTTFVWLVACAVPAWLGRLVSRDREAAWDVIGGPVGLAVLAYAGASVLSLSSLPLYAPGDIAGASTALGAARAMLRTDIVELNYPVLTVVLTLHALVAALVVAIAIRAREQDEAAPPAATLVAGAVAAGLAITILAGGLDRLGFLDLRDLRAFDPFTNPTGADRLQSTFGHAGWLAQYLCFATPAVLAAWLWKPAADAAARPSHAAIRLGAAGTLLAATFVAIVLSYQRGGWITWCVVGGATAVAAIRFTWPASGAGGRRWSTGRLIAATLVAALVAVGAGLAVIRVAGGPGAMGRFTARAATLGQVSDRQAHVTAGLRLGALLPILGGASESFAMRYREEYLLAGGEYYARGYSPVFEMYGSAHNVFAQTFAGKGAAGLVALVLVVLTAAWSAWRALRAPDGPSHRRVLAAIALGMVGAFALYGQVQEVFYIPALQLTVCAAWGMAASLAPSAGAHPRARAGAVAWLLAAVLGAHLVQAYVVPGRLAEGYRDHAISQAGTRLSAPVRGEDGQYFQWTGAAAAMTVPRQATELSFELQSLAPAGQVVEVRFDGQLIDRIVLEAHAWRSVVYPLTRMRTLPRRLELSASPAWQPPGEPRDLGVRIRRIRWSAP